MVATSKGYTLIRGRAMRLTRLDACGNPDFGPKSQVVTDGFISVGLTPNNTQGESISVTNAAGRVCILDEPAPIFSNYTIQMALCGVNPDAINIVTGQAIVYDSQATPQGVGFRVASGVDSSQIAFALEVWAGAGGQACGTGSLSNYGYFLLPFVGGGSISDFSIENAAINFTLAGATTKDGSGWGVGPYNVTLNAAGAASPLKVAMGSKDHLHHELVQVPPPTVSDGAVPLGTRATGATAGTPGTFTPANSYGGNSLTDMTGITASPGTAWTTGQYVVLEDGSRAKWNGTTWVVG